MAVGDIITAARYNIIQARVAAVIGLGSGDEGYGQARTSSTVAVGATITAQDMQNLFTDMTKIRLHQTGSVPAEIAVPSVGDTVLDSNSTNKEGYVQYETLSTTAQSARLSAAASQLGLQAGTSSSRSSSWSTDINTTFTVTFGGYSVTNGDGTTTTVNGDNHMRVFFNAGGTVNLSGSIGSGNTTINNDWRNLMSSVGTVVFGRSTTSNGSTGTNYGYVNLPTGFTTIFNKTASAYSANDYLIEAKKNGNVLTFRVTFNEDKGGNPNFDEAVTATTTSTAQLKRPNNSSSVNITAPTFNNTDNL
jgi:hypothetical protein|tara:strand:+ start:689 stop:1603 length:915 start_codon:yes stop_codon:yes gene_type:complete